MVFALNSEHRSKRRSLFFYGGAYQPGVSVRYFGIIIIQPLDVLPF